MFFGPNPNRERVSGAIGDSCHGDTGVNDRDEDAA
jgi:hypothetical protein